eukprot:scaffold2645_cov378-Prasinococcus_capsulatus_cf.AAC.20
MRAPLTAWAGPFCPGGGAALQKDKAVKSATPRLIQCPCGWRLGSSRDITKLVEWPVVDRVPARDTVLYTGQS